MEYKKIRVRKHSGTKITEWKTKTGKEIVTYTLELNEDNELIINSTEMEITLIYNETVMEDLITHFNYFSMIMKPTKN